MSKALANIWARRIYAGAHTIDEVNQKYGAEGVQAVREAYYILYGKEIEE